jgi:hypothetical protein
VPRTNRAWQNAHHAKHRDENDSRPKPLYHYTDAAGLIGILRPSAWGTSNPEIEKLLAAAAQLRASDAVMSSAPAHDGESAPGLALFLPLLRTGAGEP